MIQGRQVLEAGLTELAVAIPDLITAARTLSSGLLVCAAGSAADRRSPPLASARNRRTAHVTRLVVELHYLDPIISTAF